MRYSVYAGEGKTRLFQSKSLIYQIKTQESLEQSASIDLYGKYKSVVQQNGVNKLRRPKEDE